MEKWRDDELICLVEKKNERMENEVGINFTIMSPLNKIKKSHIFLLKRSEEHTSELQSLV